MVVVATVPIAILYPFFQRYFVKGLTIGGVKNRKTSENRQDFQLIT